MIWAFGDELLATGMARGAAARGRRVAFGDGKRIIWGPWCAEVFRGNSNIAPPGSEGSPDLDWVHHYKGRRLYNRQSDGRWEWNYDFRAIPGEMFFDDDEKEFASSKPEGFVLIEPNVPWNKSVAPNKDWGLAKYQALADIIRGEGIEVVQFGIGRDRLRGARTIETKTFRLALAALSRAALYVGPEGGLHHGAAAVGVGAVVLFGGFIPPEVTGYAAHDNLTGGAKACGKLHACQHCREAMDRISVEEVTGLISRRLSS